MSDDLEPTRQLAEEHMAQVLLALKSKTLNLSAATLEKPFLLPINFLSRVQQREVYEAIVQRILLAVGETFGTAEECHNYCSSVLDRENLLSTTSLPLYSGYDTIKSSCQHAISLSTSTGKQPCLAAPELISLIAVLDFHRVALARPDNAILEMLDAHRVFSWLSVAIRMYPKIHRDPFVIIENASALHPVARKINGI